jgi:hypothetical protein
LCAAFLFLPIALLQDLRVTSVAASTCQNNAIRTASRATGMATMNATTTAHPPPEIIRPSFRSRPLLVRGIPMRRESRDLAAEMPTARFHEKPPRFIRLIPSTVVVRNDDLECPQVHM